MPTRIRIQKPIHKILRATQRPATASHSRRHPFHRNRQTQFRKTRRLLHPLPLPLRLSLLRHPRRLESHRLRGQHPLGQLRWASGRGFGETRRDADGGVRKFCGSALSVNYRAALPSALDWKQCGRSARTSINGCRKSNRSVSRERP